MGKKRKITCQSALHGQRAGLNDGRHYSDNLGTYDGVVPPAQVCERCAYHDGLNALEPHDSTESKKRRTLEALAGAAGVSIDDIKALIG